jgi:uncharacterized protein
LAKVLNNQSLYYPVENSFDMQTIMRQVYIWMGLGTMLTAVVAFLTVSTPLINLASNPVILIIALIAELGMVMGLSLAFNRISAGMATLLFFAYAALNGFTLSVVLLTFNLGTVVSAFASTAVLFGVMSLVGYTTKVDLTKMGTYLMMGVIGLIIAMVVNMFLSNGPLDTIISVIGVLIFTGLTAYDTQRIRRMAAQSSAEGDAATKLSIMGALKLYLDFINMFLFMLRLRGGNRR